jgi:hypothetical protein
MFVPLVTPRSEAELAVMLGLLVAYEIPHYVHNRYFSALHPGPVIDLYNRQRIMVPLTAATEAAELLAPFFGPTLEYETERTLATLDRVRVVIETALGGWFMPFRCSQARENEDT